MKKFKVEFSEKNLTGNAGLTHFGRFIDKLNLKKIISEKVSISRAPNADYQVEDVIIMLMIGAIAGISHMSHMLILRMDNVIRSLFGWEKFPCDTSFGRIFKLFNHKSCNELSMVENVIRRKIWKKKWYGRLTLDFDSTVRGVFGSQEGAEVGYNPKKKGQKSYHPLLCFIDETRECLHNWFRTGSAYTGNGIVSFAKECYERLPKGVWKVFVRADSGFFNGDFLDYLENKGALYLIKVKMKNLNELLEKQKWKKVRNQEKYESTEFEYQCASWKKPRRFLAIRQKIEVETKDGYEIEFHYFCYVLNDNLTPWKAHKKYGKRATSENWIEWCKNQMASGSILTDSFWANSAIFQTCIFAYNLMVWMMWLTYGEKLREEPNTIRFWLIHVPGQLLTGSRQFLLKLSKNWYFRKRWMDIDQFLDHLQFS